MANKGAGEVQLVLVIQVLRTFWVRDAAEGFWWIWMNFEGFGWILEVLDGFGRILDDFGAPLLRSDPPTGLLPNLAEHPSSPGTEKSCPATCGLLYFHYTLLTRGHRES